MIKTCRLNVTGHWPSGAATPPGHVSEGSTASWIFPSPDDAVAFLDTLEPRPVYYSIVPVGPHVRGEPCVVWLLSGDAKPIEGANDPFLKAVLAEDPPLESFLS